MSKEFRPTPEERLIRAIFGEFPDYSDASGRSLKSVVWEVLEGLPKRAVSQYNVKTPDDIQKMVIVWHFGLAGGKGKTLKEIAELFDITRERIRQYKNKALRQLRHPSRSNKFRRFFESTPTQEVICDEEALTEAFKAVAVRYPRSYKTSPHPPFRQIPVFHLPTLVWNALMRNDISRLTRLEEVVETSRPIKGIGMQGWKFLQEILDEAEKRRLLS